MREIAINQRYGVDYQVHYNLPKPAKGYLMHTLMAAYPWLKIMHEEGGIPGIEWEDYQCDGFVTETQRKEVRLFKANLEKAIKSMKKLLTIGLLCTFAFCLSVAKNAGWPTNEKPKISLAQAHTKALEALKARGVDYYCLGATVARTFSECDWEMHFAAMNNTEIWVSVGTDKVRIGEHGFSYKKISATIVPVIGPDGGATNRVDLRAIHQRDFTDWRRVLESPEAVHDPFYGPLVAQLRASRVPTEQDAIRHAVAASKSVDSRTIRQVSALLRLGSDVTRKPEADLGRAGDFVWEVRETCLTSFEGITGLFWISTSTGKTKALYP